MSSVYTKNAHLGRGKTERAPAAKELTSAPWKAGGRREPSENLSVLKTGVKASRPGERVLASSLVR